MILSETLFYHALTVATQSNYQTLHALRQRYATWAAAWENWRTEHPLAPDPEVLWAKFAETGSKLILLADKSFPQLLKEIPLPPFGIYILGDISRLAAPPALAIVGTRKASTEGRRAAGQCATQLAGQNISIVSGLALGIDAASHAGCLAAGGYTAAVLGNGLDDIYPRANQRLAKDILRQGGALISEYPPGTPSLPYRFLERNRIISGLSVGTVVIEAPARSGALATARFALEQNREVFVVPGPAGHPQFAGSHALIRAGARLVNGAADILEDLNLAPSVTRAEILTATPEETLILQVLAGAGEPLSIDKIAEASKLNVPVVIQTISILSLKNAVQETDRGYRL